MRDDASQKNVVGVDEVVVPDAYRAASLGLTHERWEDASLLLRFLDQDQVNLERVLYFLDQVYAVSLAVQDQWVD